MTREPLSNPRANEPPHDLLYRFPHDVRVDQGVGALSWEDGGGPFGYRFRAEPNASLSTVVWDPNGLSPQECDLVVNEGLAMPSLVGQVELGPNAGRLSHVTWITPRPENHWLFHRLGVLFTQANRRFGFELAGFVDALQFTQYHEGQHFEWHLDIGRNETSLRKLSATIQLSEPGDYDGGDLEFVTLGSAPESRQRGSVTFFPSYMGHRVTPVKRGVRRSLVAWASGPPFR